MVVPVSGTSIKIVSPILDDDERGIIIQGIIDPASLVHLKVDDYQRKVLSEKKIRALMEAHRTGRVPTVELGMRGDEGSVLTRNECFYLQAPTYIVDGLQRITAGIRVMGVDPTVQPRISALIHLNTDEEWERERFDILNVSQTRLSGNVTLRNLRYDNAAIAELYRLTNSKSFILYDKVAWEQNMTRGELITATMFAKVVGMLHSHLGPGRSNGPDLGRGLEKIMKNTGKASFLQNVRTFFDVLDRAYGVQTVAYKQTAIQLKLTFMMALAKLFSEHTNFWADEKLVVDDSIIRKLALFRTTDPTVVNLASASGKATDMMFLLLVDHVNSGKRTRRLVRRNFIDDEAYTDLNTVVEDDSEA
jgi:hypothetical protein